MKVNPIHDATHMGHAKDDMGGNARGTEQTQPQPDTQPMTCFECIAFYLLCKWIETSCRACIAACDCDCECEDDEEEIE